MWSTALRLNGGEISQVVVAGEGLVGEGPAEVQRKTTATNISRKTQSRHAAVPHNSLVPKRLFYLHQEFIFLPAAYFDLGIVAKDNHTAFSLLVFPDMMHVN